MKKAFTILELLIVLSVLIILIGILIPRFKGMTDEGRKTKVKAELQTLQAATEAYFNDYGTYPPNTGGYAVMSTLLSAQPQVLSTYMVDPFSPSSYYGYSTTGNYYVWYSQGLASTLSADSVSPAGVVTSQYGEFCISNGNGC